jgi:hypothetical protein
VLRLLENELQRVAEEIVNGSAGFEVFRDARDDGGVLLGERVGVEIGERVLVWPRGLFLENVSDSEPLDRENYQASFPKRYFSIDKGLHGQF